MSVDIRGSLDNCVKCTVCETFCPVAAATPLFPGPKYAGPQSERYRRDGASVDASLDYCSGCGICTQVCPQGVDIAEINARARAEMKAAQGMPLRDRLIARPALLGRLAQPVAPLANAVDAHPARAAAPPRRRSASTATRPCPTSRARRSSHGRGKHTPPGRGDAHGRLLPRLRGQLQRAAASARMAVAVLEHNGFEVIVPPQGCCGLPLQSNGAFEPAREYVRALVGRLAPLRPRGPHDRRQLDQLRPDAEARGAGDPRASTTTTCALVGARTFDICELLRDLLDEGELRTDLRPLPMRVPYHQPCQGRGHGFGKPALDLLELIPELEVIETDRECCGVAGTYGLKVEKYPIAMQRRRAALRRHRRGPGRLQRHATPRPAAGTSRRPPGSPACTRSSSCTARTVLS